MCQRLIASRIEDRLNLRGFEGATVDFNLINQSFEEATRLGGGVLADGDEG